MKRKKRLLIGNSDRFYNFSLISESLFNDVDKITFRNVNKYRKEMSNIDNKNKKNDPLGLYKKTSKNYWLYSDSGASLGMIKDLLHYGNRLTYITDKEISNSLINLLAVAKHREVVYLYNSITEDMVDNIIEAHKACTTSAYIELDPLDNPEKILFNLYRLRTNLDNLYIRFKKLSDEEYNNLSQSDKTKFSKINNYWEYTPENKFKRFKAIKTSLSIWGINIKIILGADIYDLEKLAINDKKKVKTPKRVDNKKEG